MHKNGQQWLRMCQVENATVMNANAFLSNAAKWFTMRSECLGHKSHAFGAQITHIPCLVQGGQPRLYEKSSAERGAHPPLMNRTTHYQMTKLRNMSAANLICCSRSSLLL